jgi:hypothetical protein
MTKFFAIVAPAVTVALFAGWANAQEPAVKAPRCAIAKSTEISQTADGRTIIRVKTVEVCR